MPLDPAAPILVEVAQPSAEVRGELARQGRPVLLARSLVHWSNGATPRIVLVAAVASPVTTPSATQSTSPTATRTTYAKTYNTTR